MPRSRWRSDPAQNTFAIMDSMIMDSISRDHTSHSLTVLSSEPLAIFVPSGLNASDVTASVWPE
jgi:hypothetical protein